jgi:uncharacterized SAM-binding protein YcdF (DUF218 family)
VSLNYLLSDVVLPPTSLIALTLTGAALLKWRPRIALALVVGSQLALLALALPAVAFLLARTLEPPPLANESLKDAQAIVILGGGRNRSALEWGGETVNDYTLERLRYGAHLARATGLPVYVTGGIPDGGQFAEGALMSGALANDFGTATRWVDNSANTTRENALAAARDLRATGIERVALVTSALHMPRAQAAFIRAGLQPIAAPTGYRGQRPFAPYQLVPSAGALRLSHAALREWLSRGYYAIRD